MSARRSRHRCICRRARFCTASICVGRALGQGGFGITYLAWDLNLEMPVAIKEFLPTDFASRASAQLHVTPYGEDGAANFELGLEAFEGEARALARCNAQPGVVDVLSYFRENGTGYIVMHYLRGRTLRDHLRARGLPLPFEEAAAIVRPVLDALQEVHRLGLVHRDISPDNIYICDSGRVCLLDFGAARNAVRDRSKSLSVQFKIGYTPEEQYRRHGEQGPWTDVYAAAATFYRAMTGVTPPPSLDRLTRDQLSPPGALGVAIPRSAERALMRALAVQAARRYRTVDEFLADLAMARMDRTRAQRSRQAGNDVDRRWIAMDSRCPRDERPRPAEPRRAFPRGPLVIAALADSARLIRAWLDAALARARSSARVGRSGEREPRAGFREQLAALWPVTLVERHAARAASAGRTRPRPLDVYARDETASVAFDVVLQKQLRGHPIRCADRCGSPIDRPARTAAGTARSWIRRAAGSIFGARSSIANARRCVAAGAAVDAGVDASLDAALDASLDAGVWRFDFIWDGRKIGEREFVVSA